MKKLISMVLFITILSTLFSLNVYATSQATNYQAFLKEHKNGTIYTPKEYSKTKTNNVLFVEEFYENVFTPIKLSSLKPNNDISTNSSTEELYDFFYRLYAGDIVKIGDTYSIYISQTKNGVQLYDVDNPINDGKSAIVHLSSYNYSSLKEMGKTILSYQPNGKNYDILGAITDASYPVWNMTDIIKDTIKLQKGSSITVSLLLNKKDVTENYVYTINDNSVAYYSGGKIIAQNNGVTYITATPRNNKDLPPETLKIQVVAQTAESKYPANWEINGINGDTLYLGPGEEVSFAVYQKKGGITTYITNDLQFKISNTSIATLNGNKIKAIKEGETVLTAYSYYDDIPAPASLIIKVDNNLKVSVDTNTPSWTITGLTSDTITVKSLENVKFSLYIIKNGKKVDVTDEFNYSTRNNSVAFVDNNRIYGMEPGSTTLTATPKTTQLNSPNSLQILVVEDLDEDDKDKNKNDEDKRPITSTSYYTFWHGMGIKDNKVTMHVGDKLSAIVYLQDGTKIKDVSGQVDITTSDKNIVYIKNSNTLVATQKGTVTISGRCRGNFAPHPETITIEVVDKISTYSDKNKPIWTIDGMDNDRLSINISNYISRYITTGTVSETGINNTTDFMTFDTEDHKIAIVKKDGTIQPVSVGVTRLFATSKYAEQFVPTPLTIEVYENKGEDGDIFFAIDNKQPETLRLQPKEEVPFKIFLINKDGTQEDLTEEMLSRIQINGRAVYIHNTSIVGKELGTVTLSIDIEGHNYTPHDLEVTVRNISLNELYQKNAFKDLNSSHWAYNYIMELSRKNIINGFEDNTFRPDENITLEQALKMIVEAKQNITSNGFSNGVRTPVKYYNISPWAQKYQEEGQKFLDTLGAYKQGFYGNLPATRIEILNMLEYASDLSYDVDPINLTEFKDFNLIPAWGYTSAELFAAHGIVVGDDTGNLNPTSSITRAEMSKILYLTFYSNSTNIEDEKLEKNSKNNSNNKESTNYCELYDTACKQIDSSSKNNYYNSGK